MGNNNLKEEVIKDLEELYKLGITDVKEVIDDVKAGKLNKEIAELANMKIHEISDHLLTTSSLRN